MPPITTADPARLQAHLGTALLSPALTLDPPETQGCMAQLRVGDDVLGTVNQVDEKGEQS